MTHDELSKLMGPYNPNASHRSRMTKMGIILAKDRKTRVQKELDERIASKGKVMKTALDNKKR